MYYEPPCAGGSLVWYLKCTHPRKYTQSQTDRHTSATPELEKTMMELLSSIHINMYKKYSSHFYPYHKTSVSTKYLLFFSFLGIYPNISLLFETPL
jgi:hypothetical protein